MDGTGGRIVVTGGLVLVDGVAAPADVVIDGGRIEAVEAPGSARPEGAEIVRADDRLVMPGLVNAHTHSHLAVAKGVSRSWTLELHLHNGPWTGGGQAFEDRALFAQMSAVEMLLKGCTACYDLVMEMPAPTPEGVFATAEGYREAGIRAVVAPMMADRTFWRAIPGLLEAIPADLRQAVEAVTLSPHDVSVAACRRILDEWPHDRAQVRPALAPTIPHHCSDDFWIACRDLAEAHGVGLHTHLAESRVQSIVGPQLYGGASLTRHLDRLGIISERFVGAHGVWLDDADIETLAARGATIAHNPSSNFRLGNGMARAREMAAAGVCVALGSDACSCSDHQNLFEVMRLATYIARTQSFDPDEWLTPAEIVRMATEGGARALGMEGEIGRIAPGYLADLVFLDLATTTYTPLNDPLYQMVFGEEGRSVDKVMVGGRTVVDGGRILTVDYDALRARMNARAESLFAANGERRRQLEAIQPFVKHFCVGLAKGGPTALAETDHAAV